MSQNWSIGFVLLLACISAQAAAQTFNLRSDPFAQRRQEGAWAVEPTVDGRYLVVASSPYADSLYYSSVVTTILVDQSGEVLNVDRVIDTQHATYPGWSNSTTRRADDGFVVGGGNFTTDTADNWIQRPVLYMIASDGTVEGYHELGPEGQEWIGRQAKQTPDGGFVICGEAALSGVQNDAFLIKTDGEGNEEWTRTFGGPFSDYTVAVDNNPTGGYFLGGQYRTTSQNQDLWVQSLNDTGGVIWDRKWGTEYDEPNAHLTTAADGNILVASGWPHGSNFLSRRYLAKLDADDGSFIWERQYGGVELSPALLVVQEVSPSGDLIAAGAQTLPGNQYYGVLLRTTSNGDSLWMRSYQYHDSLTSNGRGLFRDVAPTPDGGFIACGTALSVSHADTLLYTQDVWVVKTDSMGCLEPGCHLVTGVETQITNLKDVLRVWPNPVGQGGAAQVSVELPANFVVQGRLRLSVVSNDGRLVQESAIPRSQGPHTLPGNLASGSYHIHLSDASRWISGAELVVH